MAKALQRRRGTHEEHKSFTGLEGEFTYDTTEKRIVAHDGVTKGGIPMATKKEVEEVANSLDPRILDAASQSDILEAVSQATVGNTQEPPEGLMLSHVVGEEWHSFTGLIPTGGVPYCGQLVTREVYRDLWEYAQTQGLVKSESEWQSIASEQNGNVAFYSTGDGSTTFRMPSIKGYVKGASSQSEAGEYVAEGLPNIVGTSSGNQDSRDYLDGAFALKDLGYMNAGTYNYAMLESFDASRCSPIYGNSDHVTPETNTVLFGVYAFGNMANVGELDASALATGLAKVESGLAKVESNVSSIPVPARYVVEKWSSGASWYTKYSDGWIEQGSYVEGKTSGQTCTITLNTAMATTSYSILTTGARNLTTFSYYGQIVGGSQKATSFDFYVYQTDRLYWRVEGY